MATVDRTQAALTVEIIDLLGLETEEIVPGSTEQEYILTDSQKEFIRSIINDLFQQHKMPAALSRSSLSLLRKIGS
jgi:hypothetical protein